ncbi:MAG TPA: hypothetical protein VF824_10670 [Thermoanaerobaculia bacterium]|jgi:beta-lactamase superfamily II metal-dependent hydrolase
MRYVLALLLSLFPLSLVAQANGKLQLHFIDVGQGEGALLVSPSRQTVLFDNGDLSGVETDDYLDIETGLEPDVGQVEVYKVHHHGSRYSSNEDWLATIQPRIGVISTGTKNKYGHPTQECLDRLHDAGITTFWTSRGKGATPDPQQDTIAGTVIVEYTPGTGSFTVTGTRANVHHPSCLWADAISPANRRTGTPPNGWTLHAGCPTTE